jgi:hypothetical protein
MASWVWHAIRQTCGSRRSISPWNMAMNRSHNTPSNTSPMKNTYETLVSLTVLTRDIGHRSSISGRVMLSSGTWSNACLIMHQENENRLPETSHNNSYFLEKGKRAVPTSLPICVSTLLAGFAFPLCFIFPRGTFYRSWCSLYGFSDSTLVGQSHTDGQRK